MTTSHSRGRSFEYAVLYRLKNKFPEISRVPSSGASDGFKGDLQLNDYLVECKKTMNNSIRITKEWLKKIEKESGKKVPLLIFSMKHTTPYVVMKLDDWLKLVD